MFISRRKIDCGFLSVLKIRSDSHTCFLLKYSLFYDEFMKKFFSLNKLRRNTLEIQTN